jgi:hypothetical protein
VKDRLRKATYSWTMAPKLDRHAVRVAVDSDKSEKGLLVFADGILVAVFSHLNETVDGELQDRWFLEAGFGRCQEVKPPVFDSREEAEQWVFDRMNGR